jgi:hypothetical protein
VLSPSPAQVDAKENDDHSSNGAGSVEGASDDEDGLGGYYEDDFGPDQDWILCDREFGWCGRCADGVDM